MSVVCIGGVAYETDTLRPLPAEETLANANEEAEEDELEASSNSAYLQHIQRKKLSHSRSTRKRSSKTTSSRGRSRLPMPVQTLEDFGLQQIHNLPQDDEDEGDAEAEEDNGQQGTAAVADDAAECTAVMQLGVRRYEMGRYDAHWVDEPPKKSKKHGRSYWVPSIDRWHEDFNSIRTAEDPVHPVASDCFGCNYEDGESEANSIYAEKWNRLLTKFTECLANSVAPSVIARDMHDLFVRDFVAQMVEDNIDNAGSVATVWTPYKLLYHLLFHNRDTVIAASCKIAWMHELQRTIVENELYKEHAVTGRRTASMKSMKKLDLAMKMELNWVRLKQDEMAFSVARRRIAPDSVSLVSNRVKKVQATGNTRVQTRWNLR